MNCSYFEIFFFDQQLVKTLRIYILVEGDYERRSVGGFSLASPREHH